MNTFLNFLFASVKAGTPLLFGTTGEIVTEKAGNTNLGVEGMMFMGAFMGFFVACYTDSLILALLAAFALGVFGALIYAYITVSLRANQVVTGLALTIFGSGLANFFGQLMIANYKTANGGAIPKLSERMTAILAEKPIPLLSQIPFVENAKEELQRKQKEADYNVFANEEMGGVNEQFRKGILGEQN